MEGWRFLSSDMIPLIKAVVSQVRNGGCLKGSILVHMLLDDKPVELEQWFHLAMCPKCMKLYDEMVAAGVRDAIRDRLSVMADLVKSSLLEPLPNTSDMANLLNVDAEVSCVSCPPEATLVESVEDARDDQSSGDLTTTPLIPVWLIRTPSGLSYKFTCPEALLGWKRKLRTYESLQVSNNSEQRYVDFAEFIAKFEESGDAKKSFDECVAVTPFGVELFE